MGTIWGADVQRKIGAVRGRRWGFCLLAALISAATVSGGSWPVAAQSQLETDDAFGQGLDPFDADGPLTAVVSLGSQKIRIFDRNGLVSSSPVSTGRKGFETPEGVFSIIERKVEHNSNLYDDAEMPFMQRITWSGVALHQGVVPKYRASHGCIRLPHGFAEQLFRTTKIATRVVIVSHEATPLAMSHPVLRQPGGVPIAATPLPTGSPNPPGSSAGDALPMMLGARDSQSVALPTAATAGSDAGDALANVTATSPALSAAAARAELRARRTAAEKRLQVATKAVDASKIRVRPALIAQGKAEKALRQALAMARRSEGRVQAAAAVAAATSPVAQALATTQHIEEMLEHVRVTSRADAARELAAQKAGTALAARDATAKLEDERQRALNVVRAITRRLSPVTIFVSRLTGRVYVRQGFHQVMDLPITILEPGKPLGTHVFTALDGHGAEELQWYGLTIETAGGGSPMPVVEANARKSRSAKRQKPEATVAGDPLTSARAALDRITLPDAVLARILPTLQPGSTLIVSDLGQSIETGPGTDIVVQTQGEAAAAANIAKFIAKKKAEALAFSMPVERPSRRSRGSWPRRERDAWNSW